MGKLIAKRAILYRGRQYTPGEQLPGDDAAMVAAWLKAESATTTPDPVEAGAPVEGQIQEGTLVKDNLEEMTLVELRALAKELGVDLPSKAKKDEVLKILSAVELEGEGVESEPTENEPAETGEGGQ